MEPTSVSALRTFKKARSLAGRAGPSWTLWKSTA